MIHLAVGRLEIDWGKNHGFSDHSALYQVGDLAQVPYFYVEDSDAASKEDEKDWKIIAEYKDGLSKPLHEVVDRIELLGHTMAHSEKEFLYLSELTGLDTSKFNFGQLRKALSEIDVNSISVDYGEGGEDIGKFFRREIFPRLELSEIVEDPHYVQYEAAHAMENLSPYTVLKLLVENPSAQNLPVNWSFKDLEDGGWGKREGFVRPLDQSNRFLIVTEGSSDAAIIKHAFTILKPHIADFFDYVDMEEGYPFTGTGNLQNFVRGLISISVQNNVIVLFDNDAEGVASFNRCCKLNVPNNMKILKLPDLPAFNDFETLGPNGQHRANINGQGAAIECYLHLDSDACVRWSNYNPSLEAYHGALVDKDRYKKNFLNQRGKIAGYDYSKIEAVLNMIIKSCVRMREEALGKEIE